MGQALTARTSADGIFFNPASLGSYGKDEFIIHHADTFQGQNNVLSLVVDAGVAGTFGLTYVLVDEGEIELQDDNGVPLGTRAAREQHLVVTFATSIATGLRGGISYKLYNISAVESATTHLIDAGVQYRVPKVRGLELGVSVMHAGLALQVINAEQRDPTPARARLGAAYELGHLLAKDSSVAFWVSADMVARLRGFGADTTSADSVQRGSSSRKPGFNIGAELGFDQTIFVRAGYASSGDGLAEGGGGIGIGIHYERFTIAVGKSFGSTPLQPEGEPFQITFGITF